MMQPVFETNRLLIRPRTLADTRACFDMDRDPEVTRFVDGPWLNPAAHRAFIEARTLGPYPVGLGYWSLFRDTLFIGWVLLIPRDAVGPEIEIGWRLRRETWGQGFATEAAQPIMRHAFTTVNSPEIVADIHPDNLASQRVAEKLGMHWRHQSIGKPALRYSLSRAEFMECSGS